MDALKPDIRHFHELSEGNIESIGLLFSEMARQPLPPQVICKILGMNEEDVKAAFEEGKPPTASLPMLESAVLNSVDPVSANPVTILDIHTQSRARARTHRTIRPKSTSKVSESHSFLMRTGDAKLKKRRREE